MKIFILLGFYSAAGVLAFWAWRRFVSWDRVDRLCAALVPPAAVTLFLSFSREIYNAAYNVPNWNRFEKTLVLAEGLPLYYGKESGLILNTIYGPIAAISYLPAVLFHSPEGAIRAASFLSAFFVFAPIAWLFLGRRSSSPKNLVFSLLVFIGFGFFSLMLYSLKNASFNVHTDAPTIGLLSLACVFLYFRKGKEDQRALFLSACAVVLAAWSKIVVVPALLALPAYLLWTDGKKAFMKYLIFIGILAGCLSAVFFSFFGYGNMVFNMFEIPSRHPFKDGGFFLAFPGFLNKLLREYALLLPLGIACILPSTRYPRPSRMFIFLGLCLLSSAYLGFVKLGGSRNAMSYSNYFLLAGFLTAWIEGVCGEGFSSEKIRALSKKAALVLIGLLTAGQTAYLVSDLLIQPPRRDFVKIAREYAAAHPGEAYFGTLVPVHWFAEGKFYHDVSAIMDREMAGFIITDAHKAEHFPADMKIIAFPEGDYMGWIRPADFGTITTDDALPGFVVYKKN